MRLPIEDEHDRVIYYLEGTRKQIETALDELLVKSKSWKDPGRRQRMEDRVLRALSLLNREPGAEHEVSTARRQAGGGKLVKGS